MRFLEIRVGKISFSFKKNGDIQEGVGERVYGKKGERREGGGG